ncbi:MAG TPA: BrnA antitoxin family protein [Candidatus Binataceae bacterium]|nr:BrnA antitoxin family protein [Candidatus Binataceae bacterium]
MGGNARTKGATASGPPAGLSDAELALALAEAPDDAWLDRPGPVLPEPKRAVTLRIDADVLRWFKAHGAGYQSRMNAVLRQYAEAHGGTIAGRSIRARGPGGPQKPKSPG